MKALKLIVTACLFSIATFGDGVLLFNTDVKPLVDAPVVLLNNPSKGPGVLTGGAAATAELFLVSLDGITKNIVLTESHTRFRTDSDAASKYVNGPVVTIPGSRGAGDPNGPPSVATLIFRAYQSSFGSYEASMAAGFGGQSTPFSITLGGGTAPVANLIGVTGLFIGMPEPSTIVLGFLGAAALFIRRSD
jgi:hypothetical protein